MKQQIVIFALFILKVNTLPIITDDENSPIESRKHKHKIQRPCVRSTPEGRKFFDWSFEFLDVNVNYNYNYNYNCGGAAASASQVQGAGIGSHLSHHGNGPLGLGLLPLLLGTGGNSGASSSSSSSSSSASASAGGVASPPARPVTEVPQDEVLPDRLAQLKPGTYVTATNPFFGSYTYNLNSNRVLKNIDRGIDRLLQPLWNIL